jgi:hypothetical protein
MFFAVYLGWVSWIYASSDQTLLEFNPIELFQLISDLSSKGSWLIFGYTPKGRVLEIVWLLEASIIMIMTSTMAIMEVKKQPFCDKCNSWTERKTIPENTSHVENVKEFVSSLERNDVSELIKLVEIDPTELKRTKVSISNCENCNDSHFLRLQSIIQKRNKNGGTNLGKFDIFVEDLVLSNEA